jgi:DNA polymerase III delta prime subunit
VELKTILESEHGLPSQANPDFYERSYQTFTIEDARNLKGLHETRPIGQTGKKVFIIYMNAITNEAQNALLKLFEEPSEYAHFFLVIPSSHVLLPTVRSRMALIGHHSGNAVNAELEEEARKFLNLTSGKKLEYIKRIVEDISKEKKTKQDAIDFLDAVEAHIHSKNRIREHISTLESMALVRKYIHDRAPSVKMLLEYMSLMGK